MRPVHAIYVEMFKGWGWEWGGVVVSGMCGATTLLKKKHLRQVPEFVALADAYKPLEVNKARGYFEQALLKIVSMLVAGDIEFIVQGGTRGSSPTLSFLLDVMTRLRASTRRRTRCTLLVPCGGRCLPSVESIAATQEEIR